LLRIRRKKASAARGAASGDRPTDPTAGFDAFISYSHAVDGRLAPALQAGLHRFAKPWYRLRALRVFRDETSLSATPELWPSIVEALDRSRWFILLASPEAAKSKWVNDEVEHWCTTKSPKQVIVAVTKDDRRGDFDWERTTSFPPALRAALEHEPRVVDLRWARDDADVSLHNARFRDAVADIAAPLHGRAKDELYGEDVRQHRRAIRLARSGVAALALLALVAGALAVLALVSRNREAAQARLATSRQLAAESRAALGEGRLDLALLLGAQSYETQQTAEARNVLLESIFASGHLERLLYERPIALSSVSGDGRRLAVVRTDGRMRIWDLAQGRPLGDPITVRQRPASIALSGDGSRLAVGLQTSLETGVWEVDRGRWDPRFGEPGPPPQFPETPIASISAGPRGMPVAWVSGRIGKARVGVWNGDSTEWLNPPDHPCKVLVSPDASLLAVVEARTVSAEGWVTDVAVWRLDASGRPTGDPVVFRGREGISPLSDECAPRESAAFSPNRPNVLAIGGLDGTVILWDARRGRALGRPLIGERGVVSALAFSPDGRRLAVRDAGGVTVWEVDRAARLPDRVPAAAADEGVWFGSDSRTVAAIGSSGVIALSDVDGRRFQLATPLALGTEVASAAFSPDGSTLAVGGMRGGVRLWDVRSGRPRGETIPTEGESVEVAFAPEGDRVTAASTVSGGRVVEVLDVERGAREGEPASVEGTIDGVGFAEGGVPIGLRTGIDDSTVWRPGRGQKSVRLVDTKDTFAVQTASDGSRALLRTASGVGIWDLETGRRVGPRLPSSSAAVWTSDEETIATVAEEGIALWDAESGTQQALLSGADPSLYNLAFSADGELLAGLVIEESLQSGGRATSSLRIWDVPSRSLLGVEQLADWEQSTPVFTFSSTNMLAVTSGIDELMLWDLEPDHWGSTACRLAARPLSDAEWERFLGSADYEPTCKPAGG
jgi:WD40 repeat protein